MVRAPDCGSGGRGFESVTHPKSGASPSSEHGTLSAFVGSNPAPQPYYDRLAQSVEHLTFNQESGVRIADRSPLKIKVYMYQFAGVAELADALDLGSSAARRGVRISSPAPCSLFSKKLTICGSGSVVERRLAKANVAVRIPSSLHICGCSSMVEFQRPSWPWGSIPITRSKRAPIAQLDRVTDFESGGRRFESFWAPFKFYYIYHKGH